MVNITSRDIAFHRATRRLSLAVVILLSIQLSGNIYEQLVSNAQSIDDPRAGAVVGEVDPGSPLYFYLPWVPIGIVLLGFLAVQSMRRATAPVWKRHLAACGAVIVAIGAKVYLIGWLNPAARDSTLPLETVRVNAISWGIYNGIAIAAVLIAIILITSWRAKVTEIYEQADTEAALIDNRVSGRVSRR